ncbi:MAG: amidinotransferase [Cytophagales bacterium]|nr:amidinotransferase [Cytophagales bacterium]
MITTNILDETAPLLAVVLGTAESFGGVPKIEDTYDPKSRQHILEGTYPIETDLIRELETVEKVLLKHGVTVYRPSLISDYNQVFSRDVAIVIGDQLIVPEITANRQKEVDGIRYIIDQIGNVFYPEDHERMEGGDVIPWKGHLFVGYSRAADFEKYMVARTNEAGVDFLRRNFPDWKIKPFELNKSDDRPRENALHLDCCFQAVGRDKAVIYPEGFKKKEDVGFLFDFFGRDNVFEIDKEEMYDMNSNFFSISPDIVISDSSFTRLNDQFRNWGLVVEEVKFREVAKMEGLLRCSTMPLSRVYE